MDKYLQEELDLLKEFFAIPIHLKEVIKIDNYALYSSNKLIAKYKKALSKGKQFRGAEKIIDKLINRGVLLPVFMNKGLFKLTLFKLFAGIDSQSICGFYSPQDNIVIILLDNDMTLGWVSGKFMCELTSHELIHMAASHMKKQFLTLFFKDLVKYYSQVFYKLTGCEELKKPTKIIEQYVTKLYIKSELATTAAGKPAISNFNQTLTYIHANYKTKHPGLADAREEIQDTHNQILTSYFVHGLDGIIEYMQSNRSAVRFLLNSLYYAYLVFDSRKTPNVFPIQEFFYPSEVISVKSEIISDSKYIKAWSYIK